MAVVLTLGLGVARCGGRPAPAPCCVDLIAALPRADIRPVNRPADAIEVLDASIAGARRPALSIRVPARLTFDVRIPPRAAFTTMLHVDGIDGAPGAAAVVFRVGISEGRTHELLVDRTIALRDGGGWQPLDLDLRRYAGWQWSLFYHPSRLAWQIVLYAFPAGAGAEQLRAVWLAPAIGQAG